MKRIFLLLFCVIILTTVITSCSTNNSAQENTNNSTLNDSLIESENFSENEFGSDNIETLYGSDSAQSNGSISQNKSDNPNLANSSNSSKNVNDTTKSKDNSNISSNTTSKSNKTTTKAATNTTTKSNKTTTKNNNDQTPYDGPISSSLPTIGKASLYNYSTMTPADFFLKTGKEYSSNEVIVTRFGINTYYNNKKATAKDTVTKSELVKVLSLLSDDEDVILNFKTGNETYENQCYVTYADDWGLIKSGSISSKNQSSAATKAELFNFLAAGFTSILGGDDFQSLLNKYNMQYWQSYSSPSHNNYLRDCMSISGFSSYSSDFFSEDAVTKSYLNEIIVKMCNGHAIIHKEYKYTGAGQIVTNVSNMPKSYQIYPYILKEIPNYVYDYPLFCSKIQTFLTPYDVFKKRPYYLSIAKSEVEGFLSVLLNVDYNTITVNNFRDKLGIHDAYGKAKTSLVEDYVNYVKSNQIIIKGKATGLPPVIYYDDNYAMFLMRTHVVFNVVSSNTDKNLLFSDYRVKYSKKNYDIYIDVPLNILLNVNYIKPHASSFMAECVEFSKGRNLGISEY